MIYVEYILDNKFCQFTGCYEEWYNISFNPDITPLLIKRIN